MLKLSYYQKKDKPTPLDCVEDKKYPKKVLETIHAIEMHMALSCLQWELHKVFPFVLLEKSVPIKTALSANTFPRKDIGSHPYALFPKTFFTGFRTKA